MAKKEGGYFIWEKGGKDWLTSHFNEREFECHCKFDDCKEQRISEELLNRLEWLREASHSAIDVHSGYRCAAYQKHLVDTGKNTVVAKKSTHELGDAADVRAISITIPALLQLAEKRFFSIGCATNFLHLDLRPDYRRWKY